VHRLAVEIQLLDALVHGLLSSWVRLHQIECRIASRPRRRATTSRRDPHVELPAVVPSAMLCFRIIEEGCIVPEFNRITLDPEVMGGKPCIRGIRLTVGTILGLLAAGHTEGKVLEAYPYLEREDIRAALAYATWRVEEFEVPVQRG
jgi:uncharacterized protein (DUF433 family)